MEIFQSLGRSPRSLSSGGRECILCWKVPKRGREIPSSCGSDPPPFSLLLQVLAQTAQFPDAAIAKVDILVKGIGSHAIEFLSPENVSIALSAGKPTPYAHSNEILEGAPGVVLSQVEVSDTDEDSQVETSIAKVTARDFDGNIVDVPRGVVELVTAEQKTELRLKV